MQKTNVLPHVDTPESIRAQNLHEDPAQQVHHEEHQKRRHHVNMFVSFFEP